MALYQLNLMFSASGVMAGYTPQMVFNYESNAIGSSPEVSAAHLLDAFFDNIVTPIATVMSNWGTMSGIVVKNIYDITDFAEAAIDVDGVRTGDVLPRFVSWTFQSPRLAVGKNKRARKAVPYVSESDVTTGEPIAGILTDLGLLGDAMSTPIVSSEDVDTEYVPVLVAKQKYIVSGSSPVRYAYQYYPTLVEQQEHLFVIPSYLEAYVSTQNSRKTLHT